MFLLSSISREMPRIAGFDETHHDVARAEPVRLSKPRPDVQHTSVYIPRAAFERLREIAFAERLKVHDLLMEGVDRVISERGHPERARRGIKKL
jgi:hypothetical protein